MTDPTSEQLAQDVEILAELFKAGGWTEIRIESEGIGLLLSTDRSTPGLGEAARSVTAVAAPELATRPAAPMSDQNVPPAAVVAAPSGQIDPQWIMVAAPNLGTFYRAPKPGAAPLVEIGQHVEPATEVCLIEVMKLFTSVQAGVAGTVRHVAAQDAELVEGGQALLYIERD